MLIKHRYSGELPHLISLLNKASFQGKNFFIFKKKGNYSKILNILSYLGFIKGYEEFPDLLILHLKNTRQTKRVASFANISKIGRLDRKDSVSLRNLIKLQRREMGVSYFVLNTDKGVLTSIDAIKNKVGGKPIFKIY